MNMPGEILMQSRNLGSKSLPIPIRTLLHRTTSTTITLLACNEMKRVNDGTAESEVIVRRREFLAKFGYKFFPVNSCVELRFPLTFSEYRVPRKNGPYVP